MARDLPVVLALLAIVVDALAHFTNLVGVFTWVTVAPFEYGTPAYEAWGTMVMGLISILLLYALAADRFKCLRR